MVEFLRCLSRNLNAENNINKRADWMKRNSSSSRNSRFTCSVYAIRFCSFDTRIMRCNFVLDVCAQATLLLLCELLLSSFSYFISIIFAFVFFSLFILRSNFVQFFFVVTFFVFRECVSLCMCQLKTFTEFYFSVLFLEHVLHRWTRINEFFLHTVA